MIFQKIVNDIQRFTKTEYFPISLSPSQFSNLREISFKASLQNDLTKRQGPTTGVTFGCFQSISHKAEV